MAENNITTQKFHLEKIPPQNVEAEMAVLGSMLIEESAVGNAIELIDVESFYKESHRIIYRVIIDLFSRNSAIDLITVIEELRKRGELDSASGAAYITSLTSSIPTAANIGYYAKIVKEKAILRNLINNATEIVQDCYESTSDADGILDKAERLIFDVSSKKIEQKTVLLKDIIKDSIETIDNLYQRKENITGIPTGYHEFDIRTAGLQPSDLIVIAGRPSMGKSAFATCIAEYAGVVEKIPVAFFSLEMSKEQLVQRMLCSHARVNAHNVRTGFLSQADWPRLVTAASRLSEAPIYIDDTPSISVLELKAKARRLKAQHDIKLVVLDYMQLMNGPAKSENRQQEISEISRALKALARELDVPIIAISQLSRAVEQRQDHRPQLSDLRESGAIEQDADLVVLLLREEYYTPNAEDKKGLAEIIIAKQRNGPVGTVNLTFISEYTRFENRFKGEEE
ncbi:MAG: replicative DNA helicase [Candidatus Omnitrophica bacterium]|nr:replicative DNA helicase [Candidatus Omnitrophota bacterium]MBU4488235.1 replicative DNA helicase [Candidatus Omnitrophota bacterium]MCG2704683.1 replicative DNA helicase [Candidatus Omnitrophota bacterium]